MGGCRLGNWVSGSDSSHFAQFGFIDFFQIAKNTQRKRVEIDRKKKEKKGRKKKNRKRPGKKEKNKRKREIKK